MPAFSAILTRMPYFAVENESFVHETLQMSREPDWLRGDDL